MAWQIEKASFLYAILLLSNTKYEFGVPVAISPLRDGVFSLFFGGS
jgi:hypothetical protein